MSAAAWKSTARRLSTPTTAEALTNGVFFEDNVLTALELAEDNLLSKMGNCLESFQWDFRDLCQ
jgi:hypothetical protein